MVFSEDEERGHKPRNRGGPWKLKKARRWILFWSLQKEPALLRPCLQPSEIDFGLLTSRTGRECIRAVLRHSVCGDLL